MLQILRVQTGVLKFLLQYYISKNIKQRKAAYLRSWNQPYVTFASLTSKYCESGSVRGSEASCHYNLTFGTVKFRPH